MATRWDITKAVRASDLPAQARLIMLVLADVAEVGTAEVPEWFTPSLTVLARETGLGRSTVAEYLKVLEERKWVVRTRPSVGDAMGEGRRTRYQLMNPDSPGAELVQEVDGPGGGLASPGAGHRDRSSSDQDQTSSSAKPPKAEPLRPDVERICNHLADRLEANGCIRPTITAKWRTQGRLLLDLDGRTVDQVLKAIDWTTNDPFWKANVLSMPTLRKRYDQLRLAAQRPNGRASPQAPPSNAPGWIPPDERCPEHDDQRATNCRHCDLRLAHARRTA